MSEDVIARLRSEASRGDYVSMVRLALALYENGVSVRDVLRACYDVDFPNEFFSMIQSWQVLERLPIEFTNQPWELAIPPDLGGPVSEPYSTDSAEREIFARDPDLIPMVLLLDSSVSHGASFLCYRASELRVGRTTVFGIPDELGSRDEARRYGDSLLHVLHEYHSDKHRLLELQFRRPSNRGAGSVEAAEVRGAYACVELIEDIQRRVTPRADES